MDGGNIQDVEHWFNCHNFDMRNILEHGDVGIVVCCGSLVTQGAAMFVANLSHDVPMNVRSTLMSVQFSSRILQCSSGLRPISSGLMQLCRSLWSFSDVGFSGHASIYPRSAVQCVRG